MATADRTAPEPLEVREALRARARSFTLFAALRALDALSPQLPRIGEAARAKDEAVRLGQRPLLEFAPSEVASIEAGERWRVEQFGFGLFGPNGPLPLHLTELVFDRARHYDDSSLEDFLNALQHRSIALFYRAWAASEPVAQADRPDDEFLACLLALAGLDGTSAARRNEVPEVPDAAKAARAGLAGMAVRSPGGLEALLEDYFGMPFEVRPFHARWLDIPADSRLRIGGAREHACLGEGATLGVATWQASHSFELAVGPVDRAGLERFLPGSPELAALTEWVRLYTNDEWQWQLRVLVDCDTLPGAALGQGARLGLTSWLGERRGISADVVLQGN